jgi:hypothetical protein
MEKERKERMTVKWAKNHLIKRNVSLELLQKSVSMLIRVIMVSAVSGVKSWIVRSTLPPNLIALMNEPSPILPEAPDDDDLPAHSKRRIQKEVNRREAVDSGAILDWKKGDGAPGGGIAMKGILFALLAMILVRDRMIEHSKRP